MIKIIYKIFVKPVLFAFDPEYVHDFVTLVGRLFGGFSCTRSLTKHLLYFRNSSLSQTIKGIKFENPVGLAAGFDKNAQLTDILPAVGFGFEEIGSVTGEFCPGNKKPRLWRLKKSQSLLVYYGLKNHGCQEIVKRLSTKKFLFPLGVSIAKTNSVTTIQEQSGIDDYVKAYSTFVKANVGDYFTINISCPNAFGGQPFTTPEKLDRLLSAIVKVSNEKPVFMKIPAEINLGVVDEIIKLACKYKIAGFVCSNLAKGRDNKKIVEKNIPEFGGMSGKVMQEFSERQIEYIYRKTRGKFVIIGVGGIFSAEDAYRKIKLGASLVQLITGMIFEGPQLIGDINRKMVKLLKHDGYQNISEAVGKSVLLF